MRSIIMLLLIAATQASFADGNDKFELHESHAASDVAKYHEILKSLESGDIKAAKKALLYYQSVELSVLEGLKKEHGVKLKPSSEALIEMVSAYNTADYK